MRCSPIEISQNTERKTTEDIQESTMIKHEMQQDQSLCRFETLPLDGPCENAKGNAYKLSFPP